MYKTLLVCLLLSLSSSAQKTEVRHSKLEFSFGNGVVSYNTTVGASGEIMQKPHFVAKVMYNIGEQQQVGINFQGSERTQAVDAFFNWSKKGADARPAKFYIGVNLGYVSYSEYNRYRTDYATGTGVKGGIQLGITTPPTSRVGFYVETGLNVAYGPTQIASSGTLRSPSYTYPSQQRAGLVYIPLNLGVRFRFLYKKHKQPTDQEAG